VKEIQLIFHQRDQWRHHKSQSIPHQSGQLVTQRLATTGWKYRQCPAALGECIDDFFLSRPEFFESEPLIQDLCRENRYLLGLKKPEFAR